MKKLGEYIGEKYKNLSYYDNLFDCVSSETEPFYDLVNCSFVLEEVKTAEERLVIVDSLYEKVSENGFLVFVMSGSPTGYRYLNDLRNIFASKDNTEANIIAPCPH